MSVSLYGRGGRGLGYYDHALRFPRSWGRLGYSHGYWPTYSVGFGLGRYIVPYCDSPSIIYDGRYYGYGTSYRYYRPWRYGFGGSVAYSSLYVPPPSVYVLEEADAYVDAEVYVDALPVDRIAGDGVTTEPSVPHLEWSDVPPTVDDPAAAPEVVAGEADGSRASVEPDNIDRGNQSFGVGRYDEARRWYMQETLASSENAYARLLYGVASFATGDYDAAILAIREAFADRPALMDLPVDLRGLYHDDTGLAVHLERFAEYVSNRSGVDSSLVLDDSVLVLAYLYYASGDAERGLALLDRLFETGPPEAEMILLRDAMLESLRAAATG